MKKVILSADGDRVAYLVPDSVAEHLEEHCLKFCDDWLRNSPNAEKYRVKIGEETGVCYTEADFIEYLNAYVFPDCKSRMLKNLGQISLRNLPVEYRDCPYFNF